MSDDDETKRMTRWLDSVNQDEVRWLIAEVERLTAENAAYEAAFKLVRAPHRVRMSGIGKGNCVECRETWPCFTERVAVELAAGAAVTESEQTP